MYLSKTLAQSLSSPFFICSQRKSFSSQPNGIQTVTVIGAGLMGAGIAQVTASSGKYQVNLVDLNEKALEKGVNSISSSLKRKLKTSTDVEADTKKIDQTLSRITATTNLEEAASRSDLVIEAIVEKLPVKRELFSHVHKVSPKHAIFASNTSSLSISEIAKDHRPEQFGGLHFFNPVPMMKLVEVIRTEKISNDSLKSLQIFSESIGKVVVTCSDTPGFIVNRLLVPYLMEAIRLYERGVASKEDIDTAMKLGCGYPMGPFTLVDYVGLDTTKYILDGWSNQYPNETLFKPSQLLDSLVAEGKMGNKCEKGGFYPKTK